MLIRSRLLEQRGAVAVRGILLGGQTTYPSLAVFPLRPLGGSRTILGIAKSWQDTQEGRLIPRRRRSESR
jgi:hypothetical protein